MISKSTMQILGLALLMCVSAIANAHIGVGTAAGGGLIAGFMHPLLGLDHMLAMIAVGLWAGQNGGKFLWFAPLSFMLLMAVGGVLGVFQVSMPMAEQGILISVIIFGALIAFSFKPNIIVAVLLVGAFAIFHGHSHGTEIGVTASAWQYTSGFVFATGLLHIAGIALFKLLQHNKKEFLARITGGGILGVGIAMLLA